MTDHKEFTLRPMGDFDASDYGIKSGDVIAATRQGCFVAGTDTSGVVDQYVFQARGVTMLYLPEEPRIPRSSSDPYEDVQLEVVDVMSGKRLGLRVKIAEPGIA